MASKAMLIAKQARILLSAYPRDKLADPEGFVAQLGVVLEGYPDAVIIAVTDPRTGLQRRTTFLPSIAEVVRACDDEQTAQAKRARYAALPKPRHAGYARDNTPGRRANVHVPRGVPQYDAMLERARSPGADPADWRIAPDGELWVAHAWFDAQGIGRWTRPPMPAMRAAE